MMTFYESFTLEQTYTDQYARCWRLLCKHGRAKDNPKDQLNRAGYDLLLDVANLRRRDIERLREGATA